MKKLYTLLFILAIGGIQYANAQFSISVPLLEEFTGTWCGWCADGALRAEDVRNTYPGANVISIHAGSSSEPMLIPDGGTVAGFYTSSYPSGVVNRDGDAIGRTQWKTAVGNKLQGAASVTISFDSLDYNSATRQLTVRLKANFTGPVAGDIRFNLFIAEDNVTGGSTYNQANYDNTTAGHPLNGAGNPIVGFVHQQVLRAMLGGAWGNAGTIPSSVNFGGVYYETFTTTLDAGWDENEIFLVGVTAMYNGNTTADRKILNSESMDLITATGIEEGIGSQAKFISVYPNPVNNTTKVAFSLEKDQNIKVEVLNALGQHINTLAEGYMNSGAHTIIWDAQVPNGVYLVKITAGDQSMTKKVLVSK
ncbi:MAG: Omp28-related outer membrane protein [Bacteroidia bacterium]|nr:Omp28-related outer membrane protein [Bacteroidia bacterium]